MGEKDLDGIVEGQPKLLRRLLEAGGDPDKEFVFGTRGAASENSLRCRGRPMSLRNSYVGLWIINPGNRG